MEKLLNIKFFRDGKDLIVQFKDIDATQEDIIRGVLSNVGNISSEQVKSLSPAPEEDDTAPTIPAFINEENEEVVPEGIPDVPADDIKEEKEEDLENFVITGGKHKGKTLGDMYKSNKGYLEFIRDKCNNNALYKDIYPKVVAFLDSKK